MINWVACAFLELLAWYRYAIYDALVADHCQASYAARAWIDVLSV